MTTFNAKDIDLAKRKAVQRARKAVEEAVIRAQEQRGQPLRHHVARHDKFRDAVVTLWGLGFWTDQIATFIAKDVSEATVLAALRGHLASKQQVLLTFLTKGYEDVSLTLH